MKFLDEHEADMVTDYNPESEAWKQQLALALAEALLEALN